MGYLLFPDGPRKETGPSQGVFHVDMTGQKHVGQNRHPRKQLDILKRPPQADLDQIVGRHFRDVVAVEEDFPRLRAIIAGDAVHQAGFPRPVGPDHRHQLPGVHLQVHVLQGNDAAEGQGYVPYLQFGTVPFGGPIPEYRRFPAVGLHLILLFPDKILIFSFPGT